VSVVQEILTRRQAIVWELMDYYDTPGSDYGYDLVGYDLVGRVAECLDICPNLVMDLFEEAEEAIRREFHYLEKCEDTDTCH